MGKINVKNDKALYLDFRLIFLRFVAKPSNSDKLKQQTNKQGWANKESYTNILDI